MTNIVGNIKLNTLTELNQEVNPPLKAVRRFGSVRGLCDGREMFKKNTRVNETSFLTKQSGIQESVSNHEISAYAGMTIIKNLAELRQSPRNTQLWTIKS